MEKTVCFDLTGKVAIVTGASRGLGVELATSLAEYGANLALMAGNEEKLKKTAAAIVEKTGVRVITVKVDIASEASVQNAVKTVMDAFGKIDILVNNAGIIRYGRPEEISLKDWCECIDVDVTGTWLMSKEVVNAYMLAHGGGSIINTASMSAHIVNVPQPQCAYNASKAGVIQLTKSLAIEWAKRGVRVNSISPGYIGTDLTLSSPDLKPLIAQWNAMAPMGRLGKPSELQGICVYLAGDASSFTTGADFVIDGAFTCF